MNPIESRYSVDIWLGQNNSYYMIWDNKDQKLIEKSSVLLTFCGIDLYEKCRLLNLKHEDDLLYLNEIKWLEKE